MQKWPKVSESAHSSPGIKNEFPITLITGAKNCLKKPPNALLNPSKVPRVSNLSLIISLGPKNMPESCRISQRVQEIEGKWGSGNDHLE